MSHTVVYGAVAVAVVVLGYILLKSMWKIPDPDQALLISGKHTNAPDGTEESMGFKIVTGRGTFVLPGFRTVKKLSLATYTAQLSVDGVTKQGIRVVVRATVIFKVGDTYKLIAAASRRFLDHQDDMAAQVEKIFDGHVRAILGSLTMEELMTDREKLKSEVIGASGTEMEALGLIIDSLQIQEIDDPSHYADKMAAPTLAAMEQNARVARAQADQASSTAEQASKRNIAAAERETQIAQAGYKAEVDKVQAEAAQAGPLAAASAQQEVTRAETVTAQLTAELAQQRLVAEVVKPAEAQAERTRIEAGAAKGRTIAEAEAEAEKRTRLGDADAHAKTATGEAEAAARGAMLAAEAEGLKQRAEALATNQDAVIAQALAERMPEIVRAAADPIGRAGNLTVVNGADGMGELLLGAVTQVGTLLPTLMKSFRGDSGTTTSPNGSVPAAVVTSQPSDG